MKHYYMKDMVMGWFVGDFTPTAFSAKSCEVAVKKYKKGYYRGKHSYDAGTKICVMTKGRVSINGKEYKEGDIIVMEPGESIDFKVLTDAENVIVKIPLLKNH